MNLFSTAEGPRIAGALISYKNLSVRHVQQHEERWQWSAWWLPATESPFTLQKFRLLSSTEHSYIPAPDWLKQHELHQNPHWKKLFSQLTWAHSLDNTQQRQQRNFGKDKHIWNTYTTTLDHCRKPSGKQHHCRSAMRPKKPCPALCDCRCSPHEAQHRQDAGDWPTRQSMTWGHCAGLRARGKGHESQRGQHQTCSGGSAENSYDFSKAA